MRRTKNSEAHGRGPISRWCRHWLGNDHDLYTAPCLACIDDSSDPRNAYPPPGHRLWSFAKGLSVWIGLILRVEWTEPAAQRLASLTRETWPRTSADRFATRLWSLHPAEHPSVPRARHRRLGQYRRRSNFWAFQFPKTGHGRSRNRFRQRSGPARTSASPACS